MAVEANAQHLQADTAVGLDQILVIVPEYLGVIDGGLDRVEKVAFEPRGVPKVRAAEDQAEKHRKAKEARDRLVSGYGAREHADRDEQKARTAMKTYPPIIGP